MGIYVYALNTYHRNLKAIGKTKSFTIAQADYRYKLSGDSQLNKKLHTQTCRRREAFYESNEHPEFFVLGKFTEGQTVLKTNRVSFSDGGTFERVGALIKKGNTFEIEFDDAYQNKMNSQE